MHHGPRYFATRKLSAHLLRALTGLAAMYCFFYALATCRSPEAVLLNYSAPLFIPLAALLWAGESFKPQTLVADRYRLCRHRPDTQARPGVVHTGGA